MFVGTPMPTHLTIAYLDMPLFDAELVNKRWTTDYYKTLSQSRFTLPSWNDCNETSDVWIGEIFS